MYSPYGSDKVLSPKEKELYNNYLNTYSRNKKPPDEEAAPPPPGGVSARERISR